MSKPVAPSHPQPKIRATWLATRLAQRQFLGLVFGAFALLLLLAPLPLGSNRMWAASLVGVWTNLLLVFLLAGWLSQPRLLTQPFTLPLRWAMILFACVVGWIVVQMVAFTPSDWQHPLWQEAGGILQRQGLIKAGDMGGAIALDRSASAFYLVRFLSYAAAFWLALLLTQDGRRSHWLLKIIIIAGLLYAAYGFAIELLGTNKVLWFEKRAYRDNMTSTFFNRNSYAAYAGLGLLASVTYVFHRWRRAWRESTGHFFWRDFVNSLAGREIYWVALPLVFLAALVLSASRAGFASCMAGLVVLLLGLAVNKRLPVLRIMGVAVALAAVGALALLFTGTQLLERLNGNVVNEDFAMRLGVYKLAWEAVKANPWFGYGLGNFDAAFRLFRDPSVIGWFQEAHNEYLEFMMDLGIPATILWFAALGILVWQCVIGTVMRRRDGMFPVLALAATVQEGLHSVLDFSLQIPAVAITYAALLGMGVAQSRSSRANHD
jgi:O-antigen ligase